MRYIKLPAHKQRKEILWQIIDAAVTAAVASIVVAMFLNDFGAGVLLFLLSLGVVTVYLGIESQLEHANGSASHQTHAADPFTKDSRLNALLWGMIIGMLAIGNFLFYFIRHGVTAAEVPATAPLYKEAVILAGLTVAVCLLARILHHRWHFFRQLHLVGSLPKARHLKAYILALIYTVSLTYLAILTSPYGANIKFALLAAVPFILLREFQRFDRKHHRKNIAHLHRQNVAAKAQQ